MGKFSKGISLPNIFATQGATIVCFVCRDSKLTAPLALFLSLPLSALYFLIIKITANDFTSSTKRHCMY
jgi:hypothetical protein